MALNRWVGGAAAVANVKHAAFGGTWVVGETVTVTIGSKSYVWTVTSATIATLLTDLAAALTNLSSSAWPEFAEVAWTADATHLIGTTQGALLGTPIGFALATNSGSGTVGSVTVVTANQGPNSWATPQNWSLGAVPVSTNDVVLDNPAWPILYDLDQNAVTLASLTQYATFTANLGLPFVNATAAAYPEWRPCYLKAGVTTCTLNYGPGAGSNLIKIDVGSVACALYVDGSGQSPEGLSAVLCKGTSASNAAHVVGQVGFAQLASEACNLSGGLTVGPGSAVTTGVSCTLAAVVNNGGTLLVNGAVGTSLTQNGGTSILLGTGAVAQLTATNGAQVSYQTSGTLGGNTTLDGGSVLDFSGDQRAKAVTNAITARSGSQVLDPFKVVASLVVTSPDGTAQVAWGPSFTLTRS